MKTKYQQAAEKAVIKRVVNAAVRARRTDLERLIAEYEEARALQEEVTLDSMIAEHITGVPLASWCRWSDRNHLTNGMILAWIRPTGRPLDIQADEITSASGMEVTIADLVDFIIRHPGGPQQEASRVETEAAAEAVKDVIGLWPTRKVLRIIDRHFNQARTAEAAGAPF